MGIKKNIFNVRKKLKNCGNILKKFKKIIFDVLKKLKKTYGNVLKKLKKNVATLFLINFLFFKGHHEKAKQILFEALENVNDSNHMSISVMLNSLGLAEEGRK